MFLGKQPQKTFFTKLKLQESPREVNLFPLMNLLTNFDLNIGYRKENTGVSF